MASEAVIPDNKKDGFDFYITGFKLIIMHNLIKKET